MRVKNFRVLFITIAVLLISLLGMLFYYDTYIGTVSKITFLAIGLFLTFGISTGIESIKLLKFNKESYESLYGWSNDLQGGHLLIKDLLSEIEVEDNLLLNLNNIKKSIMVYCKHDINNLRLLNAYFEVFKEEKEKEVYSKIVISLVASIVILGFRNTTPNSLLGILNTFSPLELLISFVIFISYFINITYLGNKSAKIIQTIIKECIEELK